MKNTFFIYVISFLLLYVSFVNKLTAEPATPQPGILDFPDIIINEVSFKDTDHDWIELYIKDDKNNGNGSSLKGLEISDDSVFINIDESVKVKTGDFILIEFKSDKYSVKETSNGLKIETERSGLTGTTEQVILKSGDNIIDVVCWTSSTPTQSEIKDFEEIKNHWKPGEINSCVLSDEIGRSQSIGRKSYKDTDTSNDWKVYKDPTPADINTVIEDETFEETEEEDDGTPPADLKTEIKNPRECLNSVKINEIMPNPPGRDSKNEWVEIFNDSEYDCNLINWSIDDMEGGSRPYVFNEDMIIKENTFLLLPSWQTKLNLNNSEDSVRLFDSEESLIEEIEYEDAKEFFSFALNENAEFEWTESPTPFFENLFIKKEEEEKTKKKNNTSKNPKIKNGTLSDKIFITEIFPNPEGSDKGNEWMEIYNASGETVKLGNWTIDTGEGKKNLISFKNVSINPESYLLISDQDLSSSLKNSKNTLRIKDYNNKVIDSLTYDNVVEDHSYMKTEIEENQEILFEWTWSENKTPGEENIKFKSVTGEVIEFDKKAQKFIISDENKKYNIQIAEDGDFVSEAVFQPGNILKVIIGQIDKNFWMLNKYEIIKQTSNEEKQEQDYLYLLLSSLPPLGFLGYVGFKKFGVF
jgi:hypothetical protein